MSGSWHSIEIQRAIDREESRRLHLLRLDAENMAKVVARFIDGAGQPQGPDWRSELLRQMSTAAGLKRDLAGFMDEMSRALDIPSPGLS